MYRSLTILGVGAMLGLSACSGSGTSPKTLPSQNLGSNVLQFSIGTANLYGDLGAGNYVGINVATTYRQGKSGLTPGDSAVAVSAPTLSGPIVLPAYVSSPYEGPGSAYSTIALSPSPTEAGTGTMTATGQLGTTLSTFGTAGGASGLGIEPFNFNSTGGTPYSYTPYFMPAYDPAGDGNGFLPQGFPPAFPSPGSTSPTNAYSEGLDVFAGVTPVTGTYTLSVSVPVSPVFTTSKSATLSSAALLPAWVAQNPSLDGNDDGGATFPITLPAGVTEAYIQVIDYGPESGTLVSCNGSDAAPTYYTIFVNATGTATLAPTLGAGGAKSICDANSNTTANGTPSPSDVITVQLIGFDYPWYEASYPNSNGNPAPAITGASGQSDITISSATAYQQPAGGGGGAIAKLKGFRAKHSLSRTPHYNVRQR
jgi:hypothetical protein